MDDGSYKIDEGLSALNAHIPPHPEKLKISEAELIAARLTPTCIVRDYLYADVGLLAAPGGTGKTTLTIFEHVCIALGRPVHGLPVIHAGWTLFVTAEDRREQLAARLREIINAMGLTPAERTTVLDRVRFWDVTGEQVRLVSVTDGNIVLTALADSIVEAYRDDPPVVVSFDPIVSFGASESMINDNEQAIVTAARRIVKGFDCCVRLIAHTGKSNAREKTLDQYSSRGGSALSDGARMISVMQAWSADDGDGRQPPAGCIADANSSITLLARPKLSYSPPNLPLLWVRRTGHTFETFAEIKVSREENRRATADQVERFIASEIKAGRKHSRATFETALDTLSRTEKRQALNTLLVQGRVFEVELPKAEKQGGRKTYLTVNPAEFSATVGEVA